MCVTISFILASGQIDLERSVLSSENNRLYLVI